MAKIVQSREQRRRLIRLAMLLENLPPGRFDYGKWVDNEVWQGNPDLSCGTSACAIGWATTMPEVRACGVRLLSNQVKHLSGGGLYRQVWVGMVDGYYPKDEYGEAYGNSYAYRDAAEAAFGLTPEQADWLFIPGVEGDDFNRPTAHASAKDVAIHIRRCVKEWGGTR